jgi:hypothetical protein
MSKKLLTLTFAVALLLFTGLAVAQQPQPGQPGQAPGQQPGAQAQAQGAKSADQTFTTLDANKDGKLSQAEFGRLFEMEGKANASAQEKQEEFKSWDADGDGSVSKAEFTARYGK